MRTDLQLLQRITQFTVQLFIHRSHVFHFLVFVAHFDLKIIHLDSMMVYHDLCIDSAEQSVNVVVYAHRQTHTIALFCNSISVVAPCGQMDGQTEAKHNAHYS